MAGDWIPWSKGLSRKLEVLRIAQATGRSRREVACLLMEFWEWADNETEDGFLVGMDVRNLSALHADTDQAFWSAVIASGWLLPSNDGVTIPHFDYWLGRSAKRRLKDTKRKGQARGSGGGDHVRKMSACDADKNGTTGQDRRVKKKDPPNPPPGERAGSEPPKGGPDVSAAVGSGCDAESAHPANPASAGPDGFEEFWEAYPRHTARKKALEVWQRLAPDEALRQLIHAAIRRQQGTEQWRRGVYPHAATWLRGRRWEDEVAPQAGGGKSPADIAREQEARREASRRDEERARREGGLATLSQALRGLPGLNGATEGPAGGTDAERADPPGPPGARGPGGDVAG